MKKISPHTLRTLLMPLAMIVGALLCRQIVFIDGICRGLLMPAIIFSMLFFTYCRLDMRKMRLSWSHLWLIVFQLGGSIVVYYSLAPFDPIIAQGAMICVMAPIAMASVVIGGMLGGSVENITTFSLICNMVTAIAAPLIISLTGSGECTMWQILAKVTPLLIAPFVVGQLCHFFAPPIERWVERNNRISFYIWLLSLTLIIGRTTAFIIDYGAEKCLTEIIMAAISLIICIIQFTAGHFIGKRYGDSVAGGQSLGQKNTVLAVWLSQTFLNPLACVAPTAYIVWQNLVNSIKIYRKGNI